jgi:hypothetical protein
MQFSIVGVSGDELLAGIPDNVLCLTDTADVTKVAKPTARSVRSSPP